MGGGWGTQHGTLPLHCVNLPPSLSQHQLGFSSFLWGRHFLCEESSVLSTVASHIKPCSDPPPALLWIYRRDLLGKQKTYIPLINQALKIIDY